MIRFAHTEFLVALALLPLLVAIFFWARSMHRRGLERLGNVNLIKQLIPSAGRFRHALKFMCSLCAIAFLILGLANPRLGTKMEEVKREGVDVFIALDVSNSMRAEDIKPNRLESAKRQISLMLDRLSNDRIGLIVFAGESYLQLPLTTDYAAARMMLSTIDVDVVPVQGTAIGPAIRLAKSSFVEGEKKHKVIVIITDGEDHHDDAVAAAKEAASDGVIIHTIGMGSPAGTPIPLYQGKVQVGFKKDRAGNVVLTKLNESTLIEIANAGGGRYLRSTPHQSELDALFTEIEAMEKKEFGTKVFTEYEDRFQYFLLAAFILLAVEFFISERKHPLFVKVKTFLHQPFAFRREAIRGS